MSLVWIGLGIALLVIGGEWLVRSASGLALHMKVTPLLVGLTIVSFATSAPELLVSVKASLEGHPDIAIGNVVGSNIANIGLILGLTASIFVLPVTWLVYRLDWWVMVLSSLLLYAFLYFDSVLSAGEGMVLVGLLLLYLLFKIRTSKAEDIDDSLKDPESVPAWKLFGLLLLSVAALRFGANFLIDGAIRAAMQFGVEERIISLTVVAFGTSVPELAASLIAARKGHRDIALGNVIGSNIFNILSVLGISAIITDIPVYSEGTLSFDIIWMLGFALIVYPFMRFFTKKAIGRWEGIALLVAYLLYVALLIG